MNERIESVDSNRRDGLDQIHVIGLGGCGCNTITHLINRGLNGPKVIAANSDLQALETCPAANQIVLGPKCTRGTGCGGDPAQGRLAALESKDRLLDELKGARVVFMTAGLGGGTGTGAVPVLAEELSKLSEPPLVVAVLLLPFRFERRRMARSMEVMRQIGQWCNSVIPVHNDRLVKCYPKIKATECFDKADDILLRAIYSVTDLVERPGRINLDMNDICSALVHRGLAIMGFGQAKGDDRVETALKQAIDCPLMADASIDGAKALLVNVTAAEDLLMDEWSLVNETLAEKAGGDCDVFAGMAIDPNLNGDSMLNVTVIATGLRKDEFIELNTGAEPAIVLAPAPGGQAAAQAAVQAAAQAAAPDPAGPYADQPVQRRVINLVGTRQDGGASGQGAGRQGAGRQGDVPSFMLNRRP